MVRDFSLRILRHQPAQYAETVVSDWPNVLIRVLHPDVETQVETGAFTLKRLDVFKPIDGRYDVILCFNLLLPDYFREDQVAKGTENLTHALRQHGLLIMGDEVHFSVAQKRDGQLCAVKQAGRA